MKLSSLYFGDCEKISDDEVKELISDYEEKLKSLKRNLGLKKTLSKLEKQAKTA